MPLAPREGAASAQWRAVADQIRPKVPKLAAILDDAEPDVLAYMTFPTGHRAKLHSTKPIERLNGEIKRAAQAAARQPRPAAHASAPAIVEATLDGQQPPEMTLAALMSIVRRARWGLM